MGSELDMNKLPIIDFRKGELKEGSEEWISLREQVYKALEEYGCFEALLDGIPKEKLYDKLKQLYNLPNLDTKFEIPQTPSSTGYFKDLMPLFRRMSIHDVLSPGVIESFFSNIIWPDLEDTQFCDLVHCYAKRLLELNEMVRKMVFEKLGIFEKHWDEHKNSTNCSLGMLHYRAPKVDETNVGLPPHTDRVITAILSKHQSGASGLQIMKKNGEWIDVEYSSPHSFIFLVGDILTALTNGRLPCPYHRVNMGNTERYSMVISAAAKEGYVIKVPEELVDEDHPLLYKQFDALKYYQYCLSGDYKHGAPTLEG
ncbi:putative 50S ribosomal protein L6, chloroplastic-like [Capsicum annuum]|uniref:probable 2-oxoglutarate-dependent dioxygenase AOP1 n=1 Tax=Capsicum annuum TaxID=4072 RepID=UPI001FB12DBD|nr:probable 2-oxoglutarate-dependent dioxygenase AOP1 [Capsicum annuum]KAF3627748.1 putative 50S ribosomal protein L6, chloroplastic-like [Capsicum annuum]KAF3641881.1 putative 50S ribosomal protein L6, chloroplastic-like [Capsicum annuum]